ncbi:MAG TPA: MYXO-CTERM sorting domain-containing protein [Labilithrix sp.]|jgi:MYXO-CTERM domain-containing protein
MRTRVVLFTLAVASTAHAEPILDADPQLDALASTYERQQDTFARMESGQSLDAFVKAADIQTVKDFFAQPADFATFTGKHPYDVLDSFDEHGDMGNFSGVASVGLAARLLVLERDGAPAAAIANARDACVRAARTWHVFGTIAGPGSIARGVRRVVPEAGQPALPGTPPALVPLKDAGGVAQPPSKTDSWRAPVAAGLTDWIWIDNSSKDQVAGYALAVTWLWEALHGDPAAPPEVASDIAGDLVAFAKSLIAVNPENGVDLCVRDADGRLTSFGDLNSRLISGTTGIVLGEDSSIQNGFNAALALGIVGAAYHVSGDEQLRQFYYDDLVAKRAYPHHAATTAGLMYQNEATNFSNVNMLAIALATIGRIESDHTVRPDFEDLVDAFWGGTDSRSAVHDEQPWFDVVVAGFARAPVAEVPPRLKTNLLGYPAAPTFERDIVNCDDGEIGAGSCVAVDGVTVIPLSSTRGRGNTVVAKSIVPIGVRPDTDFAWRSDPFAVNGTGSNRLDPRGDWLAAYWLARLLDRDPTMNVYVPPGTSPTTPGADGGAADDAGSSTPPNGAAPGAGADGGKSGGCSCRIEAPPRSFAAALAVVAAAALAARRRRRL